LPSRLAESKARTSVSTHTSPISGAGQVVQLAVATSPVNLSWSTRLRELSSADAGAEVIARTSPVTTAITSLRMALPF
jgi:hypothetical protein